MKVFAKLTDADQDAAEIFLAARECIRDAEKARDAAKAVLLASLGELNVGVLPDGRTVRRTAREFPETTITRKAYTANALDID